jgi:hypothetical protein
MGKLGLKLLFGAIFVWMVLMTTMTSLEIAVWDAWADFKANPWAMATLWDAYFGFITFYCWVAWKERTVGMRSLWFVLIMALGNIAMSAYVLIELFRLKDHESPSLILQRRAA